MPTKGNVWRITSKALYHKKIRLYRGKIRESEKAEDFASGSARNSASLSFSFQPFNLAPRRMLVWRSEATPLVIDKHTPWFQLSYYQCVAQAIK